MKKLCILMMCLMGCTTHANSLVVGQGVFNDKLNIEEIDNRQFQTGFPVLFIWGDVGDEGIDYVEIYEKIGLDTIKLKNTNHIQKNIGGGIFLQYPNKIKGEFKIINIIKPNNTQRIINFIETEYSIKEVESCWNKECDYTVTRLYQKDKKSNWVLVKTIYPQ